MPIGRYKVIRGVTAPVGGGGLPPLSIDTVDQVLLSFLDPQGQFLLRYDIRPNELAPSGSYTLTGKERVSGKALFQSRTAGVIIPTDARFNGFPSIEFGVGSGTTVNQSSDLRLEAPPPASFTGFVVAAMAPSLRATPANARLVSFMRTSSNVAYLTLLSSGFLMFGIGSIADSQSGGISNDRLVAGDVPFVVTYSYNRLTNKIKFYYNGVFIDDGITLTPFDTDSSVKIGIGGVAGLGTGTGWVGGIARSIMFESEMSASQITTITNALKTKYGIA